MDAYTTPAMTRRHPASLIPKFMHDPALLELVRSPVTPEMISEFATTFAAASSSLRIALTWAPATLSSPSPPSPRNRLSQLSLPIFPSSQATSRKRPST